MDWNSLLNNDVHFVISFLNLPSIIENYFSLLEYFQSIVYLDLFEINNHIQLDDIPKRLEQQRKPKENKDVRRNLNHFLADFTYRIRFVTTTATSTASIMFSNFDSIDTNRWFKNFIQCC